MINLLAQNLKDTIMTFINTYSPYISYILVLLVFLLVLKLLRIKTKTIIKLLINIVIGGAILFCVNLIPGISISIDIFKSLAVGIFGIPAVIVILVLHFFF